MTGPQIPHTSSYDAWPIISSRNLHIHRDWQYTGCLAYQPAKPSVDDTLLFNTANLIRPLRWAINDNGVSMRCDVLISGYIWIQFMYLFMVISHRELDEEGFIDQERPKDLQNDTNKGPKSHRIRSVNFYRASRANTETMAVAIRVSTTENDRVDDATFAARQIFHQWTLHINETALFPGFVSFRMTQIRERLSITDSCDRNKYSEWVSSRPLMQERYEFCLANWVRKTQGVIALKLGTSLGQVRSQ